MFFNVSLLFEITKVNFSCLACLSLLTVMLLGYWHWWTNLSRAVIKKEEYFLKRCWLGLLSVYSILKCRCNFLYQGLVPSFGYLALPPPQWICETSIANTRTKKLISMVLWLDTLSSVYPIKIKCVHLKLWVIRLLIVRQLISENYQSTKRLQFCTPSTANSTKQRKNHSSCYKFSFKIIVSLLIVDYSFVRVV